MPWKVGTMWELRLNFVHEVVHLKKTIVQSCRKYGISRKTGYKWLTRYRKDASSVLIDRSRRPVRSPSRSEAKIEAEVLSVRDQFGWGAPKIWAYLRNRNEGLTRLRLRPTRRVWNKTAPVDRGMRRSVPNWTARSGGGPERPMSTGAIHEHISFGCRCLA